MPETLLVKGQGVIEVTLRTGQPSLALRLSAEGDDAAANALWLTVDHEGAQIRDEHGQIEAHRDHPAAGLDADPACAYWLSLDSQNRRIRYGKGEVRLETQWLEAVIPGPVGQRQEPGLWTFSLSRIHYENVREAIVWRDPLAAPLPLLVVASDAMTMDMAAMALATVPTNLAPEAQRLYEAICGESFTLNSPDFPNFTDAIEASIQDPNGWCHKTLAAKANEFGEPDPEATYLRITLGVNQGESPGVPFVLEIWPPGHRSPIHNHAGAHAVIRVLHGAITVSLYPLLSTGHQTPFASQVFGKGSVTWISPRLNQTHKLHNSNLNGPTCMTIQCYAYGSSNDQSHYEYFDYIDNSGQSIQHFDPNSDMDFVAFKALMRQEWLVRQLAGG
ncbi:MAG: cysteine dioxygenase family protein [Synechococcaceae cyanobacterium]|nr:cysteine dioxygenase family protein [Synechococcaceae cyanobacterium]